MTANPKPSFAGAGKIFNPAAQKGPSVFAGSGVITKTTGSPTLFVTNLPPGVPLAEVEKLFTGEDGFRSVRQMVFVDFHTVGAANAAMRKRQGAQLPGVMHTARSGIMIDYDKDPRSKRNKQYEKQRLQDYARSDSYSSDLLDVNCVDCRALCLRLRIPLPKTFANLPRRKTDGSIVIDCIKYVIKVSLSKGEVKALKRPEGIETQYRMNCKSCGVALAYSSVPHEEDVKIIFLLPDTVHVDGRYMKGIPADLSDAKLESSAGAGAGSGASTSRSDPEAGFSATVGIEPPPRTTEVDVSASNTAPDSGPLVTRPRLGPLLPAAPPLDPSVRKRQRDEEVAAALANFNALKKSRTV